MKNIIGIALVATIVAAMLSATNAVNTVCVNVNSQIGNLYCDGVDYVSQLTNAVGYKRCDCIQLPICKVIGIRAVGVRRLLKTKPGIQFCQTATPMPYQHWVCKTSQQVPGDTWMNLGYDTSDWKVAVNTKGKCKHCHQVKTLPCQSSCFWGAKANKGVPKSVNCVLTQCGDECGGCQQTGPGKCDPGMCNYGTGVNALTSETLCNRRCRVETKAWPRSPSPTGDGFIKVTDLRSGSVDIVPANTAGYYLTVIDMSKCTFLYKNYSSWTDDFRALKVVQLNEWSLTSNNPMINNVAVDLGVGGSPPPPFASFAPWGTGYALGQGQLTYLIESFHNTTMSAVLTGVQNGPVTVSDIVTTL